jgi:hypothetical protein
MNRNDPALYRQMSAPFDTIEQSNEAISAFFAELSELRKKHRISDVICLCEINVTRDDGEEIRGSAKLQMGDSSNYLPMIAREYGAARQEHEEGIASIVAKARRARRAP